MSETQYPDYVQKMMEEAEGLLTDEDDPGPCEAAGVCFDILVLFPEHQGAKDLIRRAFRDPHLIRENRRALSRLIDEWDDRPWQQHRRLALSYRYVSRWDMRHHGHEEGFEADRDGLEDVKKYLHAGRVQLLEDYLSGQNKGAEVAWQIFQEAIRLSKDKHATLFWVGNLYAEQGYFAESVDVLEELLRDFPEDKDARRLCVEVRWWRDHQDEIPWLPPRGNGNRFRRMMLQTDPNGLAAHESSKSMLNQYRPPKAEDLPPDMKHLNHVPDTLNQEIDRLFENEAKSPPDAPIEWGYLDAIERREIDVSKFPTWARDLLDDIDDPEERQYTEEMLLEQFSNRSLYEDEYFEEDDTDDEEGDSHGVEAP